MYPETARCVMAEDGGRRAAAIMTAAEQVAYLRDEKNVGFELVGEGEAMRFLEERTFFFKLKAFAKDFEKYVDKPGEKGRYVNLDFGHLVELSRLDNALRSLVLMLALDVEHYLKVRTNAAAMRAGADPYGVVEGFLESSEQSVVAGQVSSLCPADSTLAISAAVAALSTVGDGMSPDGIVAAANAAVAELSSVTGGRDPGHVRSAIRGMVGSPYSGQLAAKYADGPIPLWVLLELVSFGPLTRLYQHCFGRGGAIGDEAERVMFARYKGPLRCTQQLRNAAAHNDCLLNGLSHRERRRGVHGAVRRELVAAYGIDEGVVAPVASVRVAMDLAALLMCHEAYVPEGGSRSRAAVALESCAGRFGEHAAWFSKTYAVDSFIRYAVALMETFAGRLG